LNLIGDFLTPRRSGSRRRLGWHGARVAHIGVVMCFVGIAGAEGYSYDEDVAIKRGESQVMDNRTITFEDLTIENGPNFKMTAAQISVTTKDKTITMNPAISIYDGGTRTSEVDIKRSAVGDLYIALTAVEQGGQLITLRVLIKPLINWLWIGSILMSLGSIMALISWSRAKKTTS
jgi:cytochrome c-type biogenesis protein CcmF